MAILREGLTYSFLPTSFASKLPRFEFLLTGKLFLDFLFLLGCGDEGFPQESKLPNTCVAHCCILDGTPGEGYLLGL